MTGPEPARPPLILVADDEPEVRDFVADVLTEAGFSVLTVGDGEKLAERAVKEQPRLIVVDLMMPGMDGYTAVTRLRGHPLTQDIPVIVLTGQSQPVFRTLSAGVGAAAHLTKPFSGRQLTETVRRVLAEHTR